MATKPPTLLLAEDDPGMLRLVRRSLELAGYPDPDRATFRASNAVGDAVLLYALHVGPLADRTRGGAEKQAAIRASGAQEEAAR